MYTTSVSVDRDQQSFIGLMKSFFQFFTLPLPVQDWSGKTRTRHLSPSNIEFEFMSFLYEIETIYTIYDNTVILQVVHFMKNTF